MFGPTPCNHPITPAPKQARFDTPYSERAPARLWLPRAPLTACIRAIVARSTVGVALDEAQRFNHFPAYPGGAIAWLFEGTTDVLDAGFPALASSPRTQTPSRVYFCGPFTRPSITFNSANAHGMMLLLQPDAFAALTGQDCSQYLNRVVAAEQVFDASWCEMFRAVQQATNDDDRAALMQDFLQPRWAQSRPESSIGGRLLHDWFRGAMQYFAFSGLGRSLRQLERRFKRNTGFSMRELRSRMRGENAFFVAARATENGNLGAPRWAEVAADAGYADQSHLCRQTRRVTGFSPDELYRRMCREESFWIYRLWAGAIAPQPTPKDRRHWQ